MKSHFKVLIDRVVTAFRGLDVTVSKLTIAFDLSPQEANSLVREMVRIGVLSLKGRDPSSWVPIYGVAVYRYAAPVVKKSNQEHKQAALFDRFGRGVCARCGGPMPGRSQRGRVRRGHTQEICDRQMVERIHMT